MKFGLKIKNGELKSQFGKIGEVIADSLNRDKDIYYLKTLKNILENLNTLKGQELIRLSCGDLQGPIKIHSSDYSYLKINNEIITSCFYNEFEEDGNPEIEMGSIKTSDFLLVLSKFLNTLILKNQELIQTLDPLYSVLDIFIENKTESIALYKKRMDCAKIYLKSGNETIDINYRCKIYNFEFIEDEIHLTRNRQYQNQQPTIFKLNNNGIEQFISFLNKDFENWYKMKMKMYYDDDQKLIVVPDED